MSAIEVMLNRLAACRLVAMLMCASPLAAQRPPAAVLDAADRTAAFIAAFEVAIERGRVTAHGLPTPRVACLSQRHLPNALGFSGEGNPDSAIFRSLAASFGAAVVLRSRCVIRPGWPPLYRNAGILTDTVSSLPGILIWVEPPVRLGDGSLVVWIGYWQGPLSSADWQCGLRKRAAKWEVFDCQLRTIS